MPPRHGPQQAQAQPLSSELKRALQGVPGLIARVLASPVAIPDHDAEQLVEYYTVLDGTLAAAENNDGDMKAIELLNALGSRKDTFLASTLKLLATATRMAVLRRNKQFFKCVSGCLRLLFSCWRFLQANPLVSAAACDAVLRTLLAVVRMGTFQALARQAMDATAALQSHGAGSSSSSGAPTDDSNSSGAPAGGSSSNSGSSSSGGARADQNGAFMCMAMSASILKLCLAVLTNLQGMAEGGRLPAAAGPAQDSGSDGGNPLPAQLGLSDFYR